MICDEDVASLITAMHQQITRGGDHSTTVARLLRVLVQRLGAVSAALTVLSEGDPTGAVMVAAVNLPSLPPGTRIALENTVLGQVASDAKARLFQGSLGVDAALSPPGDSAGSVCWPLRFHSMRWGALAVHRGNRAAAFCAADLERGAVITSALSVLMENARVNHQHEARSTRLMRTNRDLQAANQQLMAALLCAANELKTTPACESRQPAERVSATDRLTWIPKAVFLQDPSR
jgi:uncharacterized protein YigA (DUF484 family)